MQHVSPAPLRHSVMAYICLSFNAKFYIAKFSHSTYAKTITYRVLCSALEFLCHIELKCAGETEMWESHYNDFNLVEKVLFLFFWLKKIWKSFSNNFSE